MSCKEELSLKGRKHQGMSRWETILRDTMEGSSVPSSPTAFFLSLIFFPQAVFRISSFKCITLHTNPKGNQPWISTGRTDAEVDAAILWPPDWKSWLTGEDPDAGKDWGQEKRATVDEMVGCHHQLNRHESEQTSGDSEGQGSLVCCSPWDHKELDTLSNWTTTTLHTLKLPLGLVVVPSLAHVWLFLTQWVAAHQASLSFIISWSLLKLVFIESVMSSNHLILSSPSPVFNVSSP